jgi:acylphosphatase
MSSSDEAIRATASGRVQGVGYRASVVERARELGVLGWVRNQDDGTVLLHAEGTPEALRELEAFLREGPPAAVVSEVAFETTKVEGHEQFAVRGVSAGRFVVEERAGDGDARFFLLRLEVDGTLRSWRLAKAPSMVPADKRFASQLQPDAEPDPREAEGFFDHGTYEQGGRVAWPEAIERGHAVFVLHGDVLRGGFALQRTRGTGPSAGWLLIKRRDEFAAA